MSGFLNHPGSRSGRERAVCVVLEVPSDLYGAWMGTYLFVMIRWGSPPPFRLWITTQIITSIICRLIPSPNTVSSITDWDASTWQPPDYPSVQTPYNIKLHHVVQMPAEWQGNLRIMHFKVTFSWMWHDDCNVDKFIYHGRSRRAIYISWHTPFTGNVTRCKNGFLIDIWQIKITNFQKKKRKKKTEMTSHKQRN